jgi:hypothetical protein
MNDLWQAEELLFAEIADQLKPLPEFTRFAFTNNSLKVLVDSNPETRSTLLRKETPSPVEILNRWAEQSELLRFCGLNESLDFQDAQDFSSLVDGAKEVLDSKMARMFNSMEKPKKLCNLVQISNVIRKIHAQKKSTTLWIPKLLLKCVNTDKLKSVNNTSTSGIHPRIAAQELICIALLKDFKTNHSLLKELLILPANAGKIIAVFDHFDLPRTPLGIKFTTSKQETEMRVIDPGIICEFAGQKPFGNPAPKILTPPIDQFFASNELKVLWNNIGKNCSEWSDASDVVKLIAWNVSLNSISKTKLEFSQVTIDKLSPPPLAITNVSITKINNPPIIQIPADTKPSTLLDDLVNSFKALPADYRILDQDFAKFLNTFLSESAIVIRTKALPPLLGKLISFEKNTKPQLHDTFLANLKLNLLSKGLALLPKEPLPLEYNDSINLNDSEFRILPRFSDSITENQYKLIRFGIAEGLTVIEKAIVHRSMGKYPSELKEMIDILSKYPVQFSFKFIEKLEDFAINKNNLQLASTDFYQLIYQDENIPIFESNPELAKQFMQKLELYLRKNFAIKTFDPIRRQDLPENYIETMQGRMATNGRIRKVIRPGLIDDNDRLRMTALVERD